MLDSGNTAFMLLASALVLFMTPGLAFFYGGLVGRKNVMTIMMQSFVSMGVASFVWWAYGYSLAFSGGEGGIIGNLDKAFMHGVTMNTLYPGSKIPEYVFMAYQMMVAIITPALISGAFTNRMRFGAYLSFLVLWLTFVYVPFAHMVWGGGLLAKMGVLDFGGGIVVHNIAGMAALASVFFIGKRKVADATPSNLPLMAIGMGILWFGWFGFNCGNVLGADTLTGLAFLNTQLSGALAAMSWMIMDMFVSKKPKVLGFLTGGLAGLVVITPCAGYVTVTSAGIIGILAGVICFSAVSLKNKMHWDDALDVWGVHGIGGLIGILLLGLLADKSVNATGADGLFNGNAAFFGTQLLAIVISSVCSFGISWFILRAIQSITRVRTTAEEEANLDLYLHGEAAYEPGVSDFEPAEESEAA